jgi:hypothetical protein
MAILQNTTVSGSLVVTGDLTARQFILSSSVTFFTESFASGSTRFGDSLDDTMVVTGSMRVTGSITTSIGSSFIVGAGSNYVAPSPTRGAIQINGSTDQFLNLGTNGYIMGSSTLCRFLSTPDLDFVVGGSQRMFISSSGNMGVGTTTLTPIGSATNRVFAIGASGGAAAQILLQEGTTNYGVVSAYGGDMFVSSTSTIPLIFGTNTTEKMRITSAGKVGIGTTNPSQVLDIQSSGVVVKMLSTTGTNSVYTNYENTANFYVGRDSSTGASFGGSAYAAVLYSSGAYPMEFWTNSLLRMTISSGGNIGAPTGTNIYNASDARLKQNVTTITNGLDKVIGLNPIKFNWLDGFEPSEDGKNMLGFIAQEVQNVIPEAVENFSNNSITIGETIIENPLRVNEKFIIPVLVKAIQELSAKVTALENK